MNRPDTADKKIENFVLCLVKAVKVLHFYPESNPMCQRAVERFLDSFSRLSLRERVSLNVSATSLQIEDTYLPMNRPGLSRFARQLYLLGIEKLTFHPHLTVREVKKLGSVLSLDPGEVSDKGGICRVLEERGIERVEVTESRMPEIVEMEKDSAMLLTRVIDRFKKQNKNTGTGKQKSSPASEKSPLAAAVDLDVDLPSLSPTQIDELIDDPRRLARLFSRLSVHPRQDIGERGEVMEEKPGGVQQILEVLEDRPKENIFARFAASIIRMDTETRDGVIKDFLLPALLEARTEGEILRFFPDTDLARSLAFLEETGVSLPAALSRAIKNLHISERRKSTLLPLLEDELRQKGCNTDDIPLLQEKRRPSLSSRPYSDIDPDEFNQLNIMLNSQEKEMLEQLPDRIVQAGSPNIELHCLVNLVRLETDLEICRSFVSRISTLLEKLIEKQQWKDLAFWLTHLRRVVNSHSNRGRRSATLVKEIFSTLAANGFIQEMAEEYLRARDHEEKERYFAILEALGDFAIPTLIHLLDTEQHRSRRRTIMNTMLELAPSYSVDSLLPHIHHSHWYLVRNIVWLLGRAGPGGEDILRQTLDCKHPRVRKEAIRSLGLIASPRAMHHLMCLLDSRDKTLRKMAIQHLSYMPCELLKPHLRNLLFRKRFLRKGFSTSLRLIESLREVRDQDAQIILHRLSRLRFCFWSFKLAYLGWKARATLKRKMRGPGGGAK